MKHSKRRAGNSVYQLKVTLRGSKPPIWRRIQVTGDTTLEDLHWVLQAVMGWEACHMHQFLVDGEYYGEPDPMGFMEMANERGVRLARLELSEKSKFMYEYDFGDGWQHDILVEKILPREDGLQYPRCMTGKRACPPEDCGGIWGFYRMLDTINDPSDPEHEEMREWLGDEFDPDAFDPDTANASLNGMAHARTGPNV